LLIVFRHLTVAKVKILLRALRREPLSQILRNLRRLLSSKLPESGIKRNRKNQADIYLQYLKRENNPLAFDPITLPNWIFPHSDSYTLAAHAMTEVVAFVKAHPEASVIYCDEDQMDENGNRHSPNFKPGWSPETLLAYNYIGEPLAVRKEIWPSCQVDMWAFWLSVVEKKKKVAHLPKVLKHRVKEPKAPSVELLTETLQAHLNRTILPAKAFPSSYKTNLNQPIFHLQWPDEGPLVSILIPSKNQAKLLKACLTSLEKTTYKQYEILVLDNASDDPQALDFLESLQDRPEIHV